MSQADPVGEFEVDELTVKVFEGKQQLAVTAAASVANIIRNAIAAKGLSDIIVATGASQFEFLAELVKQDIDWPNVSVFHLDEYAGFDDEHPASFRSYLRERLFDVVRPGEVNLLRGEAPDLAAECHRYGNLLECREIDVACIGIGENGHIAFNDPPVADFDDPLLVKIVELDEACRRQQQGEGWFDMLEDVPTHALSLTVPAIMRAKAISCVVPDARKSSAVRAALCDPVCTECPASVLRRHPACVLYLDAPAAGELPAAT